MKHNKPHKPHKLTGYAPNSRGISSRKGFPLSRLHEAKNTVPYRGGGGTKPPKKGCGGDKTAQVAILIASFSLITALLVVDRYVL